MCTLVPVSGRGMMLYGLVDTIVAEEFLAVAVEHHAVAVKCFAYGSRHTGEAA